MENSKNPDVPLTPNLKKSLRTAKKHITTTQKRKQQTNAPLTLSLGRGKNPPKRENPSDLKTTHKTHAKTQLMKNRKKVKKQTVQQKQ
jgi:hypothetical protein